MSQENLYGNYQSIIIECNEEELFRRCMKTFSTFDFKIIVAEIEYGYIVFESNFRFFSRNYWKHRGNFRFACSISGISETQTKCSIWWNLADPNESVKYKPNMIESFASVFRNVTKPMCKTVFTNIQNQ